jgi:hypothetical protein
VSLERLVHSLCHRSTRACNNKKIHNQPFGLVLGKLSFRDKSLLTIGMHNYVEKMPASASILRYSKASAIVLGDSRLPMKMKWENNPPFRNRRQLSQEQEERSADVCQNKQVCYSTDGDSRSWHQGLQTRGWKVARAMP